MKTLEEIQESAIAKYGKGIYSIEEIDAYVVGYTQCQNDMDKKYTEEDMKKAFKFYAYAHISQQPHSYEKLEQDYLQFIQSLNKQH
jgi:hypothetical protein